MLESFFPKCPDPRGPLVPQHHPESFLCSLTGTFTACWLERISQLWKLENSTYFTDERPNSGWHKCGVKWTDTPCWCGIPETVSSPPSPHTDLHVMEEQCLGPAALFLYPLPSSPFSVLFYVFKVRSDLFAVEENNPWSPKSKGEEN